MTPTMQTAIENIAVVGGGLDAWISAACLARKLHGGAIRIVVCPTPDAAPAGPLALSSSPVLSAFHEELDIDERDLIRFCRATFRLGAQFVNWARPEDDYVIAFGAYGAPIETVAFHHYWLKTQYAADGGAFDRYALAAEAGRAGKFAHPSADPADIRSTYGYGLHLDRERYTEYMRKYALHYGVQEAGGAFQKAIQGENAQSIDHIALSNGETLSADLVLDCSGPEALIAGGALESPWRAYPAASALNKIAFMRVDADISPSLTRIEATQAGWMMDAPLQNSTCRTIVFDENGPLPEWLERVAGDGAQTQSIACGRRHPWSGNVVAVGEAAARLDPLMDPRADMTAIGLSRLIELLPAGSGQPEATEYNRIMNNVFDRCRDFQVLHYWLAKAGGYPWARAADAAQSPMLLRKRRQFESRGRTVQYDEETFNEEMWTASFLGAGVKPERYDRLADNQGSEAAATKLKAMRRAIADTVETMPGQMDYLRKAKAVADGKGST